MIPIDPPPKAQRKATPAAYRLSGFVDGRPQSYLIAGGSVRVGSRSNAEIRLPLAGVSREHAELTARHDGVLVEDRGSKNGTWIGGERVVRAVLEPGGELTAGPVTLRLERAHPHDAELALSFGSEPEAAALEATPALEETDLLTSDGGRDRRAAAALESLVEGILDALSGETTASHDALGVLLEHLGAAAVAEVSWTPGEEPVVHATVGDIERLDQAFERRRPTLAAMAERSHEHGEWRLDAAVGDGLQTGILPLQDERTAFLLVLEARGERAGLAGVLRLASKILAQASDRPLPPPADRSGGLSMPPGAILGRSAAARRMARDLEGVAGGEYPVLLLGETGAGKDVAARTVHLSSPRATEPFVALNCAAIPADLLEAEVFGVAKGAATGVAQRPGCFRRADGGTLFLDEIGEMRPELQAKLLRALESGEVQPVGGPPVRTDVRIVSATNADLDRQIADGDFRADLYYRLAAAVVELPPLRERRDDIPLFVEHLIEILSQEMGRRPRGITRRALDQLLAYPWPGNLRELQHELRRAVQQLGPQQVLDSARLSAKVRGGSARGTRPGATGTGSNRTGSRDGTSTQSAASDPVAIDAAFEEATAGTTNGTLSEATSLDLRERLAAVEHAMILEALRRTGGNKTQAAGLLGITRNTLAIKMAQSEI